MTEPINSYFDQEKVRDRLKALEIRISKEIKYGSGRKSDFNLLVDAYKTELKEIEVYQRAQMGYVMEQILKQLEIMNRK